MKPTATSVAWVFAAAFYAAAVIGFIPNPLLGPDGLFMANTASQHRPPADRRGLHGCRPRRGEGVRRVHISLRRDLSSHRRARVLGNLTWRRRTNCSASSISTPWTTSSTWVSVS